MKVRLAKLEGEMEVLREMLRKDQVCFVRRQLGVRDARCPVQEFMSLFIG
jgi:hypothetical protein